MPRSFFGGLTDRLRPAAKPVASPFRPVATPATRPLATPVKPRAIPQPITLPRGEHPTGERTDIEVPLGQMAEDVFVAGTVAHVTSSWLRAAQYDRHDQTLAVTFLDGFTATYEGVPEQVARDFVQAPSKGAFVHDVLLGPGYKWNHPITSAYPWH